MDLEIKRGDTLDHFAAFQLIAEDGSLLDPSGWTPTSQVLFTDGSRQNLTATKVNDSTLRTFSDANTIGASGAVLNSLDIMATNIRLNRGLPLDEIAAE